MKKVTATGKDFDLSRDLEHYTVQGVVVFDYSVKTLGVLTLLGTSAYIAQNSDNLLLQAVFILLVLTVLFSGMWVASWQILKFVYGKTEPHQKKGFLRKVLFLLLSMAALAIVQLTANEVAKLVGEIARYSG